MELDAIRDHWKDWATRYALDLRATTKTHTIKALEVDAFSRAIRATPLAEKGGTALEVGCGNGLNCLTLAHAFTGLHFVGIDNVPEMVENATRLLMREPSL